MSEAAHASQARVLLVMPNIGKPIAHDLRCWGVNTPADVAPWSFLLNKKDGE